MNDFENERNEELVEAVSESEAEAVVEETAEAVEEVTEETAPETEAEEAPQKKYAGHMPSAMHSLTAASDRPDAP